MITIVAWLLWTVVGIQALLALHQSINLRFLPPLESIEAGVAAPTSFVVPARNEAAGVEAAVRSMLASRGVEVEVIAVDDQSSDGTGEILERIAAQDSRLRVIHSDGPPTGWLGKPAALERGRIEAAEDWLCFVDADVSPGPDCLARAHALAASQDADMVFLLPRFHTEGALETAVMSHIILLATAVFPAWAVGNPRLSFAGGAGAFNLVRRELLEAAGAFESLATAVVDDIHLGLAVKAAGGRQAVAVASADLELKMYADGASAMRGFEKNCYPGIHAIYGPAALLLALPIFIVGVLASITLPIAVLASFGLAPQPMSSWLWPSILVVMLQAATMARAATLGRLPWWSALLGPLREGAWLLIFLRSAWNFHRHGLRWRDRSYPSI